MTTNKLFNNIVKEFEKGTNDPNPLKAYIENDIKINGKNTSMRIINDLVISYVSEISNNKKQGYLYCFHTEILKYYGDNVYKLGRTKNLTLRQTQYDILCINKGKMLANSQLIKNYIIGESLLFLLLNEYRLHPKRELFKCELKVVNDAFKKVETIMSNNSVTQIIETFKLKDNMKSTEVVKFEKYIINMFDHETIIAIPNLTSNYVISKIKRSIVNQLTEDNIIVKIKVMLTNKFNYNVSQINQIVDDYIINDPFMSKIINDVPLFEQYIKLLSLFTNSDLKKSQIDMIQMIMCPVSNSTRVNKCLNLINWIETRLNINRFEVELIELTDIQVGEFVNDLRNQGDTLHGMINIGTTTLTQVNARVNNKLKKIKTVDRVKKLLSDLYNMFGNIITWNVVVSQRRINKLKATRHIYTNFQKNNDLINQLVIFAKSPIWKNTSIPL